MERSGGRAVQRRGGGFTGALRLVGSSVPLTALCVTACTPVTTRPDFQPDPRALVVLLDARPERVTAALAALVAAESLTVVRADVRDGYVETAWYDPPPHGAGQRPGARANLAAAVKLRFWADPYVPGQTRLTIEPVRRPRYDPSRSERDLEVMVSKDEQGYKLAERFAARLTERFGVPKAAQ